MWSIQTMMSKCILLIVLLELNVLKVQTASKYFPAKATLKKRNTPIVDKTIEDYSNIRTLKLTDENILAGTKNTLVLLNKSLGVLDELKIELCSPPSYEFTCQQEKSDTSEYYCQNYIRTIAEVDDENGKYFVCGTNALYPLCYYITENLTRSDPHPDNCQVDKQDPEKGLYSGREIGAFNPDQNVSSLLIDSPDGKHKMFYTATSYNSNEALPMIRRTNMSNLEDKLVIDRNYDKLLDKPQFVGDPIEYNDRVYFFLRENAQEFSNAGRTIFSRVAAVCKNDVGGDDASGLPSMWTTYIKARLNCSIQAEYPFYYDHLQDVYQSQTRPDIVFAVFTTQEYGQAGSALCTYNMAEIENMIENGDLKGQVAPNYLWLPPKDDIVPRTGCCNITQPEVNYDKIRANSLLDYPIPNLAGNFWEPGSLKLKRVSENPLLQQKDVRFLELVVHEYNNDTLVYIGTNHGTLIKFIIPFGCNKGYLSQEINLEIMEPVLTMELWYNWIYIGSENALQRVPLNHCNNYDDFRKCLSKDPYCTEILSCGAIKQMETEMKNTGSWSNVDLGCEVELTEFIKPENITADAGDVVYQYCHATIEEGFSLNLRWFLDDTELTNGTGFQDFEYMLQGEIIYDYQYGKRISNEVQSYLRIFVSDKTEGVYKCEITAENFKNVSTGHVKQNERQQITDSFHRMSSIENERLKDQSERTKDSYEKNNKRECVISEAQLCEDVTAQEIDKRFKDSNPYIGMNKLPKFGNIET